MGRKLQIKTDNELLDKLLADIDVDWDRVKKYFDNGYMSVELNTRWNIPLVIITGRRDMDFRRDIIKLIKSMKFTKVENKTLHILFQIELAELTVEMRAITSYVGESFENDDNWFNTIDSVEGVALV